MKKRNHYLEAADLWEKAATEYLALSAVADVTASVASRKKGVRAMEISVRAQASYRQFRASALQSQARAAECRAKGKKTCH